LRGGKCYGHRVLVIATGLEMAGRHVRFAAILTAGDMGSLGQLGHTGPDNAGKTLKVA
jgi:hypothetical protein